MNTIGANIGYKLRYQSAWYAWALSGYIAVLSLMYFLLVKFSLITPHEGSLAYRSWTFIIAHFFLTMRFKEDFNLWLTFGSTRGDIFVSLIGVAFIFSLFFSGFTVLERAVIDSINRLLNFRNFTDPFLFFTPYAAGGLFMQFIFFLMLSFCLAAFGLLLGSLFYRFGKVFTLLFWLIGFAVPAICYPLIVWLFYPSGRLSESFGAIGYHLLHFDLSGTSVYLAVLTIVFAAAAFLNIRGLARK